MCNLIETGCFVRFMGHLTGFAPKSKVHKLNNVTQFYVFSATKQVQSVICTVLLNVVMIFLFEGCR